MNNKLENCRKVRTLAHQIRELCSEYADVVSGANDKAVAYVNVIADTAVSLRAAMDVAIENEIFRDRVETLIETSPRTRQAIEALARRVKETTKAALTPQEVNHE